MDNTIGFLKEKINGRRLFIYGAWSKGASICRYCEESNISVEGYIDAKSIKTYYNKPVISWDEFLDLSDDCFVLVSLIFHEEIVQRMKKNDIPYLYLGTPSVLLSSCESYCDVFGNIVDRRFLSCDIGLSLKSSVHMTEDVICDQKNQVRSLLFSDISVNHGSSFNNNYIFCCNHSVIRIGKNVHIGEKTKFLCEDYSCIDIQDNVKIGTGVGIQARMHSSITFGKNSILYNNIKISAVESGNICIGEQTSIARNTDLISSNSSKIHLGKDCMVSYYVNMRSHNGHSIIDKGQNIIHEGKRDIILADHIWVGMGATIMPGAKIGKGSVVGAKSFVNNEFGENVLLVGNPAKVCRNQIDWDRDVNVTYSEWAEKNNI